MNGKQTNKRKEQRITLLKNMMKRVGAAVAAAVMLAGFGAATANAQEEPTPTGTLTVTSKSAEFNGKKVTAIRMFSATVSGEDSKNVAYTLESK